MHVARLVERAQAGDVDAFTELAQRYQAMAFGYAYATLGDFDLAEDAAQQAFITAWRNLDKLSQPERFGGWLRGIVRFESLHLLRSRTSAHLSLDVAEGIVAGGPGPAELAEGNETADGILAAIGALPEAERTAAVLYYIHDHRQRDVAAFLGLPVSTVNNRLRNARQRLRQGGLAQMASDAFRTRPLPDDFAARIGEVIRTDGAVIDARFPRDGRPPILNAVTISDSAAGLTLTAQVAQYLDDDVIRCFALEEASQTHTLVGPGATIRDFGEPVPVPLGPAALRDIIDRIRQDASQASVRETGIKAIDLFCPLPEAGTIALVGDMQTGKMVLVEELIHRLGTSRDPLSVLVFVETSTEVAAIQQLDYRTSGAVEAIYLPVADASPEALAPVLGNLDAVITLSRTLGKEGLYPAIDPLRSTSRLLDPAIIGQDHNRATREARTVLESGNDPELANRLRRYLTQPFYVAEAFTNRAGQPVPREVAVADLQALLDGSHADLGEDALYMIGSLPSH